MIEIDTGFVEINERRELYEEVNYLHRSMFRDLPAAQLVKAYVRAHAEIDGLSSYDARQLRTVRLIVTHQLDAVGIEPWLRCGGRRHCLCAKMLLLAHLAECDACHLAFVRGAAGGRAALIEMGLAAIVGCGRLLRGYVQKVRYDLL